jgi:outer membrane protein OmpA-like peptidoglycan-associated protein
LRRALDVLNENATVDVRITGHTDANSKALALVFAIETI